MDIHKYTYHVSWSENDQECIAIVAELPSLPCLGLGPDRHPNTHPQRHLPH
ncbi:hypothetical protein ckrop_0063 [Corynebacterium kroppenstedtii DSM 44385]|uniref:Uncharacterized protein n=1 Tax=Corynebacterium kroppenstedtii (strain DSM 44385 / JCM 11950 / CIP 105744 / CCUG 35717) TaxID=645127 RepID=C4LLT4_CORK4|nr:hypothetical protein ckrop_0063 [Corynebacterium kroppenstedtii DSM 44385]